MNARANCGIWWRAGNRQVFNEHGLVATVSAAMGTAEADAAEKLIQAAPNMVDALRAALPHLRNGRRDAEIALVMQALNMAGVKP